MKNVLKLLLMLIVTVVLNSCAASTIEDETIEETNTIEIQATEQDDSVNSGGSGNTDPDRGED